MNHQKMSFLLEEKCGNDHMDTDIDAILHHNPEEQNVVVTIMPVALIKAASTGDRYSIQHAAWRAAEVTRKVLDDYGEMKKQEIALLEWVTDALEKMKAGEEPNEAFNWKASRRGRKAPSLRQKIFRSMVAIRVRTLVSKGRKKTIEDAVATAADETGLKEETVWKYYQTYKDDLVFKITT